ncbi:hypothetical protein GYMLUDRAFT_970230 [Collybiopsis luxurians FD-317 M1]|uniref:Major facilitator superfamily (MFS) profile domain-containing protein n=1 Tax=Collybiopsis luxurians FD-317 M1 TaxID=944289 RepID=A0A0D0CBN0_9AGAR|nr:hypothetical protein GYMLUDRAFT_970230 [Collybiopsis luxurians FD-317 M1]
MNTSIKAPSSIELATIPSFPSALYDDQETPQIVNTSNSSQLNLHEYGISTFPLTATSSQAPMVENVPENAVSLPPMDGGFHAWAYLVSAWCMTLLTWSLPFSYGIFLNFYTSDPDFERYPSSSLALVGSLCNGILYLTSPIILLIINRYPRYKKNAIILGVVLCVSGLLGAAFARTISHLIITQGIMFSIGGSLVYYPMSTYFFEWFWVKRGIANGVMTSGTGVGGIVIPFVVESLLENYGRRAALSSLAIAFFLLAVPCLPFIKPRVPIAQVVDVRSINMKFLTRSPFWILFIANLVQGLGSFLPSLYLPTFASDLNLSTTSGTLAISLFNGASALGLVFLGWLSDAFDVQWSILISSVGSALAVFLLWGFARSFAPLLVFACVYGFLGPSWTALWPRFVATSDRDPDPRQASTLMGTFIAGRGIGSVLSAPIASGLLSHPWYLKGKANSVYGFQGYGPLIAFTGITLLTSSLGSGYRFLERKRVHQIDTEI